MSTKSEAIHAELHATGEYIARMFPEFIEDDDVLKMLIDQIANFRKEVTSGEHRTESLAVIDGFTKGLSDLL